VHHAGNTAEIGRTSTITDGGPLGGGVCAISVTAFTLASSTVASNRVSFSSWTGYGGGIALIPAATFRTGLIVLSSIVGNSINATGSGVEVVCGAGVYADLSSGTSMTVRRSSISRNVITVTSTACDDGAFRAPAMYTFQGSVTMTVTNVTLNRISVSAANALPPHRPHWGVPFSCVPVASLPMLVSQPSRLESA
jgi:hypothetical protein